MTSNRLKKYFLFLSGTFAVTVLIVSSGWAVNDMRLSKGQTVYVPIYSHILGAPKGVQIDLTGNLSIRNTDLKSAIIIVAVDYYDSEGKMIQQYQKQPKELKAMSSIQYVIKQMDRKGGTGANFIVRWRSEKEVNAPIMEGVMVGSKGLAFISRGQEIRE